MIDIKDIDREMVANNLQPSEAIHPGEMLRDELEERKISQ